MPEWTIKKGMASIEIKDYLASLKDEDYIRISIELESSHERLRRSFHVLLREWFNSGEWSCNGSDIKTYEKFRNYYKLMGCDNKPAHYIYKSNYFKTIEELKDNIDLDFNIKFVSVEPKSWIDMTKKEKSKALDCLLTEIKYSMTSNQKVLEWKAKIEGDIDMLNDVNYYKNINGRIKE